MEVEETYTNTITEESESTIYNGVASRHNDSRVNAAVSEYARITTTTTVTTYNSATDEQVGDPVVTESNSDTLTGRKQSFPLDVRNIDDATVRAERFADLGSRITDWLAERDSQDVVTDFIQNRLDTFLENL